MLKVRITKNFHYKSIWMHVYTAKTGKKNDVFFYLIISFFLLGTRNRNNWNFFDKSKFFLPVASISGHKLCPSKGKSGQKFHWILLH